MRALSSTGSFAIVALLAFGAAATLPLACAFPGYTYDLPGTGGGTTHTSSSSGSTSTSSGTGGTGGSSSGTTSSTGGGSSTSSTSSSSTSGTPCASQDCSDPACSTSFTCIPAAPTGWTGFFTLYDDTAISPGCGSTWPTSTVVGNDGIVVPDAECTCKDCPATGQVCSPGGSADTMVSGTVDELLLTDAACNGTVYCGVEFEVPSGWNGACYGPDGFNSANHCGSNSNGCTTNNTGPCAVSILAQQLKLTGGTCGTPSAPTKVLPPVTWTNNAEACGDPTVGTGCNAGHSCLPNPPGGFVQGVCVMQAGEVACPAGFTHQHLIYDPAKTVESRSCDNCTCGALTGGSCSATINVYSDTTVDTCNTLIATLKPSTSQGDCQPLTGSNPSVGSRKAVYSAVTPGSCAAGGGAPKGTATPGGTTTFCCTQ